MQIVSCGMQLFIIAGGGGKSVHGYGLVFPVLPLFVKSFQYFLSDYKCAVVWVLPWIGCNILIGSISN